VIIMTTGVESHHHAKISTSTHFPILWKSSVSVDVLVAGQHVAIEGDGLIHCE